MSTAATMTAPGLAVALPESALDMVPLGVSKVDRQERLTYGNRKFLQMAGLPDWRGYTLADVFCSEDLDKVREVLKSRFEERVASEYRVDLTRHDDRRVVPVSITSFPETNEANEVIGTLALVRDLTLEMAQKEMYRLVERESESKKLLDAIAESLVPLVPFDRISVIRLNQERTHLRTIYDQYVGREPPPQTFRWWLIPPSVKCLLDSKETLVIDDVRKWYENDPARRMMLADPVVQKFLEEGLVSTISLAVSQNDSQVASIVLYRTKERGRFSDAEKNILEELPLAEAVSVAMRNETEGNLTFLIELMKLISSAYGSVKTVAQTIVDKISEHHGWDYVSIYQVYEHLGEIRLIAEKAIKDDMLEPEETTFPLDRGVIGHVYREKKSVNIGDIKSSLEFREIFIARKGIETNSELCVPVGEDRRWLLNIEDKMTNAFAPEELRDLESIASGLSSLLKRTLEYQYRSAVVERANDAIILTDVRGRVLEVNPATTGLLGLSRDRIVGEPIKTFLADPEAARALVNGGDFPSHETVMLRGPVAAGHADKTVKVLLSVAQLPDETGGKIFIASDMTQLQRIEQLELAQELHREVTWQIKTPMSLAISWLRRFGQRKTPGTEDVAAKVIQQLQKAELTLDRMMLLERGDGDEVHHEALISVNDMLDSIIADMPVRDREVVAIQPAEGDVHIRADAYEVRYCLQTALSYLLRLAAEEDRIELSATVADGRVAFAVSGRATALELAGDIETDCRTGQVRAELSLGRSTLERLASRNHGDYVAKVEGAEHAAFAFAFPVVRTGARS